MGIEVKYENYLVVVLVLVVELTKELKVSTNTLSIDLSVIVF